MLYRFVLLSIFLCSSMGSFSLSAAEEAPPIEDHPSQDALKSINEKIKEACTLNNEIKEIGEKLETSDITLEERSALMNQKQELINQQEKALDKSRDFMSQIIQEEASQQENSSSSLGPQTPGVVSSTLLWFLVKTHFYCLEALSASSKALWFLAKTPFYCLETLSASSKPLWFLARIPLAICLFSGLIWYYGKLFQYAQYAASPFLKE